LKNVVSLCYKVFSGWSFEMQANYLKKIVWWYNIQHANLFQATPSF